MDYEIQGGSQRPYEVPFWPAEMMEMDADEVEEMDAESDDDQNGLALMLQPPVAASHYQGNPFQLKPRAMPLRLRHFPHKWLGERPYDRYPAKRYGDTSGWN